MYEKALVPIDGSEFSVRSYSMWIRLAQREVVLVATIESVSSALARQTGVVSDVPPEVAEQVLTAEPAICGFLRARSRRSIRLR